jgi:multicomponent Na+:H+ antiporter subunit B
MGILESKPQEESVVDQKVIKSHQQDQKALLEKVHDTENNKVYKNFFLFYRITAVVCCVALVAILLIAVSYLPPVGNPENPAHNEVVDKYIEDGLQDTGAVNVVTGMILDYRAFDTFGESNVLFIATCTVLILMRNDKKKPEDHDHSDRHWEPKSDAILQKVTFILFPIIAIYGIYVVLNGHLSPGGGFSGGAIIGAGLILYLNAYGTEKTRKFFTEKTYKYISFAALLFYCLSKAYSFYTGAHHLESGIPLGTPGAIISSGLILPLNICVGMVVACTMYSFYTLFRKEGF